MEKVYIFGASEYGKRAYRELKERYEIVGFLDNDTRKWNTVAADNIAVLSPHILNEKPEKVIIASAYANEIIKQMREMSVRDYKIFPSLELSKEGYYTDKALIKKIDRASLAVYEKLRKLDIQSLNISDYNKKYLKTKSLTSLFAYSRMLYHMLAHSPNMKRFLDYGGGTGILSILALELGIEEVYFNDIYDISCSDAEKIANAMGGGKRKAYIEGDVENIRRFCSENNSVFDGIASYDVLEHIYDLKKYFKELKECLSPNGMLCMETGANSYNKKFRDEIAAHHLAVEFIDREKEQGHKERDSLRAYFDIRRELIQKYLEEIHQKLKESDVIALAFLMRGLRIDGIKKAVDDYLESGTLPAEDKFFRYNTCDPYTGNWAEHVINFEELTEYLTGLGFRNELLFDGRGKEDSSLCRLIAVLERL